MNLIETCALVTGGASGIGEATVRTIVSKGGKAAILDMDTKRGEELCSELGPGVIFCKTDVTSETDVKSAISNALDSFGKLNVVLNFAGIAAAVKTLGREGPHDLDLFKKIVDVNLNGTFNVSRLAAEKISTNEPNESGLTGVIINTASVAGYDGQKGQAAYGASKAGVIGLTLPMARDLASYGIRVNTIAPGLIITPMLASLPEEAQEALSNQPLLPKRLGSPSEIAHLACFMIENEYLNGEVIRLDAGIRLP
jgi:NAD(P)-dependent dehydrogenase (short-subunit alcohol dehydrogenase family)